MHLVARDVLEDCRLAHHLLENTADHRFWRVQWIGALALIRAVGHVLHKVDGQNPDLKQILLDHFKRWKSEPEHAIFNGFIEPQRNLALKEYELSFVDTDYVSLATGDEGFEIPTDLFRPIMTGYGRGEDARDVYSEAILWWDQRLYEIETVFCQKITPTA